MFAWQATVQDEQGVVVVNPSVTVYLTDGVTLALIYNEDGSPKANPFIGTLEGFVQFWADAGEYRVGGVAAGESTELWVVTLGIRDRLNLFDFGFSYGMADATSSLQKACDYAASIGGASILITPDMGIVNVSSVFVSGNTVLTGGGYIYPIGNNPSVISASGSLGSQVSLTQSNGVNSIVVSSTSGFSVGDYIILADNFSYTPTDSSYKNGQTLRIQSISGLTVTVDGKIAAAMDGGLYTVANSAYIRKVNLLDPVRIDGINFVGNWESTSQLVLMSYVREPVAVGCSVSTHGNSAFRFNGCLSGVMERNDIRSLRMDIPNGRAGYACVLSGPDRDSRIVNNRFDRVRHGFTTLGGSLGYPRGFMVSGNIDTASLTTSFDTHASAVDCVIEGNTSLDSSGNGIVIRSPRTSVRGNSIVRPSGTAILLTETNLRSVIVEANDIQDGSGVGIDCPQSCPDLTIQRNTLSRIGNRAIRAFSSATSPSQNLRVLANNILGFGLAAAGVAGIETAGSNESTGAIIRSNLIDEGSGNAGYAIRTAALTGSDVSENLAKGSFSASAFDLGTNTNINNRAIP